ncbi:hypothetical protein SAMN02745166_01545 [Prosthecobacter debontii]|uniref:Uncharacterized protein n=1 Tax=Prosthecobacter debontii TaxID=48467 RepID=A0A1T4XI27_9BACT|nr:hypothetical protein SAMN02745166_01545 [Prosthecobacter debontii]
MIKAGKSNVMEVVIRVTLPKTETEPVKTTAYFIQDLSLTLRLVFL